MTIQHLVNIAIRTNIEHNKFFANVNSILPKIQTISTQLIDIIQLSY
jgi:hypothetical protein